MTIPTTDRITDESPVVRYSLEYVEGRQAFNNGKSLDDCPYESKGGDSFERYWWHSGYLAERSKSA